MEKGNTKKIRNDIIFIAALLLVIAIIGGCLLIFNNKGDTVLVKVDGQVYGRYSLHENRVIEIKTENGYNILVIENGSAYVREASCPDGVCSSHKPIPTMLSKSIICLPNKVVISIETEEKEDNGGVDVVA